MAEGYDTARFTHCGDGETTEVVLYNVDSQRGADFVRRRRLLVGAEEAEDHRRFGRGLAGVGRLESGGQSVELRAPASDLAHRLAVTPRVISAQSFDQEASRIGRDVERQVQLGQDAVGFVG